MRTWRNWQTRKIQVLMVERLCRFKSCCPHQSNGSFRCFLFVRSPFPARRLRLPVQCTLPRLATPVPRRPLSASAVRQVLLSAPSLNSLNFFVIKRMFELFCFIEEFIHFCNQAIDFLLYMFYNLI